MLATAAATTSLPFDCSADFTDCWECLHHRWSPSKFSYCCKHENIGCGPVETTAAPELRSQVKTLLPISTTLTKSTTHKPGVPVVSVQYPKELPPRGLDGVLVDTICHGQDLVEVAIEGASDAARAGKGNLVVAACRLACLDTPGCIAWSLNYGSAGMQGKGHCWLKTSCTGRVKDTRAISGTISDAKSRDAQVVDGGDAIKRMEEKSLQTKKIVGGVVGAGMGALAVGLMGGFLGKKATDDAKKQAIRDQQVGGVGGTRGMGGMGGMGGNLDTGYLNAGSTVRNDGENSAGTASGSSKHSASFADAASMSSAANTTNTSASGLRGVARGSAAGATALPSSGGDTALVVPDASGRQEDLDSSQDHALTWWWIPLLLLLACLLCFGTWWLCKKLTAAKSSRNVKTKGSGRNSRKRGVSDVNIDVPASPASSVCSEVPMLDNVESCNGGSVTQQARSAQVGGDLFDAIDTNNDGIIDKAEFERAMGGSRGAGAFHGGSATMLAGGSASMLPGGGNATVLMQQQQWQQPRQQQQTGWFGRSAAYEGASATMSVGSLSPRGGSVTMLPAGASVSLYPPVTLSHGASVSILPPTTMAAPAHRMYTGATVTPPARTRSMSPPASLGRQQSSYLPQYRAPAWL